MEVYVYINSYFPDALVQLVQWMWAGFDRMGLPPSRARCGSVDALQTVKVQYRCARTREGKGVEIGGIGEALAFVEKHRRKVCLCSNTQSERERERERERETDMRHEMSV